jgi:acetyl esterase
MASDRHLSSSALEVALQSLSFVSRAHPWAWQGRTTRVFRDIPYGPRRPEHLLDVYVPPGDGPFPVVIYLHGGGFRMLSKESHWMFAEQLARAGHLVFSINYRLAPEHPYPAACEDAARALAFVLGAAARFGGDPEKLIFAGESAGANLATALGLACCHERDEPWARRVFALGAVPRAVAAFCGILETRRPERFDRMGFSRLVLDRIHLVSREYLSRKAQAEPPGSDLADPLTILEEGEPPARPLPRFFVSVGLDDPLADDSRRLDAALGALGVPRELALYPGEFHAFQAVFWKASVRDHWARLFLFLGEALA